MQPQGVAKLFYLFAVLVLFSVPSTPLASAQSEADKTAVLALNVEFYRAFRESDMTAMENIWGEREPIATQHPSTDRIEGRAAVLSSWSLMMRAPPDITCEVETVRFVRSAWHVTCLEKLNPGTVRMINIFQKENAKWKMIYHGPAAVVSNV